MKMKPCKSDKSQSIGTMETMRYRIILNFCTLYPSSIKISISCHSKNQMITFAVIRRINIFAIKRNIPQIILKHITSR